MSSHCHCPFRCSCRIRLLHYFFPHSTRAIENQGSSSSMVCDERGPLPAGGSPYFAVLSSLLVSSRLAVRASGHAGHTFFVAKQGQQLQPAGPVPHLAVLSLLLPPPRTYRLLLREARSAAQ